MAAAGAAAVSWRPKSYGHQQNVLYTNGDKEMIAFPEDFRPSHASDLQRTIRNHRWEQGDGKLIVGSFAWEGRGRLVGPDGVIHPMTNKWTSQALTNMLSVYVAGGAQSAAWYFAPFSNNAATPAVSWTAATFNANATEVTNYAEATRPQWVPATPTGNATGAVVTTQTDAVITASAGGLSIAGCGILSASGKGSTGGVLLIAMKNDSGVAVAYAEGNQPVIGYTLTLTAV